MLITRASAVSRASRNALKNLDRSVTVRRDHDGSNDGEYFRGAPSVHDIDCVYRTALILDRGFSSVIHSLTTVTHVYRKAVQPAITGIRAFTHLRRDCLREKDVTLFMHFASRNPLLLAHQYGKAKDLGTLVYTSRSISRPASRSVIWSPYHTQPQPSPSHGSRTPQSHPLDPHHL